MGSNRREGHPTEPERKPCSTCGKDVTWTQAGVPRFHKCEPKPGVVAMDAESPTKMFRMFVDSFDDHLLVPGVLVKWKDIDEKFHTSVVDRTEDNVVFLDNGDLFLTTAEIEFIEDTPDSIGGLRAPAKAKVWIYHPESCSFLVDYEEEFYAKVNGSIDASACNVLGPADSGSMEELTSLLVSLGWPQERVLQEVYNVQGSSFSVPEPEPLPAPKKITADLVIAKYIETRDEIEAEKKLYDAKVADLKALQEKRETWLRGELEKMGLTSFKTIHGTCFVDWKDSATVADAATFMAWVHEDWDERKTFLENRVSKTAVKQRLEDGETPPPGVNYTKVKDVKIRRA